MTVVVHRHWQFCQMDAAAVRGRFRQQFRSPLPLLLRLHDDGDECWERPTTDLTIDETFDNYSKLHSDGLT